MATPMHPVNSSQLAYIGYDEDTNTLYVVFHNNSTWEYDNVPKKVFEELKSSSSIGSYFSKNIKGKYSSNKVK